MATVPFTPSLAPLVDDLVNYSLLATNAVSPLNVNTSVEPPDVGYSLGKAIVIGLILSLIPFFSIAGNILVCVAIFTNRSLHKVTNYFIVSLAVADLLVASLVMTFAVVNDILGHWIFARQFCSVWISFDIMCSTASILNLCSISLDRYLHIRYPLHYDQWMQPRRVYVGISAIWLVSAAMSFIPIHLGLHQMGMERSLPPPDPGPYFFCLLELNPYYAIVSSLVSFYMPCLFMVCTYIRLFQYAKKQLKSIKKTTRFLPADSDQSKCKMNDHKAAITLGVIMGTFLFCWVPFFTVNIIGACCPTCVPIIIFTIFTWVGYMNSALNPIIYSIFNTELREAFKKVLSFRQCRKDEYLDKRRPVRFTHVTHVPQNSAYGSVKEKQDIANNGNAHDNIENITQV